MRPPPPPFLVSQPRLLDLLDLGLQFSDQRSLVTDNRSLFSPPVFESPAKHPKNAFSLPPHTMRVLVGAGLVSTPAPTNP